MQTPKGAQKTPNNPVRVFLCLRFLVLFLPLFLQASCSSAQVLGLPIDEAAGLLRKGDTGFIYKPELPLTFIQAESRLNQLFKIHYAAPFYAGLLIRDGTSPELEKLLFCAALRSPSLTVRQEAALKLIPLILEAENEKEVEDILGFLNSGKLLRKTEVLPVLKAACLYRLGRFEEVTRPGVAGSAATAKLNEWARLISLFSAWRLAFTENPNLGREIAGLLYGNLSIEVQRWAYEEVVKLEGLLSPEELIVLPLKFPLGNYTAVLQNIRQVLINGGLVFFRYPALIADLGRVYQYNPAMREEGAGLFKNWAELLEGPGRFQALQSPQALASRPGDYTELISYLETLDGEALKVLKYPVLFYAGRIERAMETYAESSDYFRRALEYAPNPLQSDSCIWYMLMNAMVKYPSTASPLFLSTMPQWNDVSYFSDVLDRLSCYLAERRDWDTMYEIFSALEAKGASSSLAQYAWIVGRAVELGFIKTGRGAESFFRIAFENGKDSFYYRAMATSKLGEAFTLELEKPGTASGDRQSNGMLKKEVEQSAAGFLLGFFECGAASLALPYIREREGELSFQELRTIAGALAGESRWKESLDLVSRYTSRADYELSRHDLQLFYPQPFRELIEKYALEVELGEEMLYGLIRTESYFISDAVSRSGAVGLAQLMGPTAAEMADRIARRGGPDYRFGGLDLKEPELNIHLGSYYLRYLTEQMGNPMLALLAYNGGMGRVRRWLNADRQKGSLPLDLFLETVEYGETREYGRRVLAAAAVYGYLYYGMSMEEVAADIYRL